MLLIKTVEYLILNKFGRINVDQILTYLEFLHVPFYRVLLHTQGCLLSLLCFSSSLTSRNRPTRCHHNLQQHGLRCHLYHHRPRDHLYHQPDHYRRRLPRQVRLIATELSSAVCSTWRPVLKTQST